MLFWLGLCSRCCARCVATACSFRLQVQGRILLPAAAMLEMVLATSSTALHQASAPWQLGLGKASIAAPLVLSVGADLVLSCKLRRVTGQLELASGHSGAAQRVHMLAEAGTPCYACLRLLCARPQLLWPSMIALSGAGLPLPSQALLPRSTTGAGQRSRHAQMAFHQRSCCCCQPQQTA